MNNDSKRFDPDRRTSFRLVAGVVSAVAAVGMTLAAGGFAAASPGDAQGRALPSADQTIPTPSPNELTGITGPGGDTLGYVPEAEFRKMMNEGEPSLDIGSGKVPTFGFRVRNLDGKLVGYLTTGWPGFISLDTARDDAKVDAIFTERAHRLAEPPSPEVLRMQAELREMDLARGN